LVFVSSKNGKAVLDVEGWVGIAGLWQFDDPADMLLVYWTTPSRHKIVQVFELKNELPAKVFEGNSIEAPEFTSIAGDVFVTVFEDRDGGLGKGRDGQTAEVYSRSSGWRSVAKVDGERRYGYFKDLKRSASAKH
jgi:hypothetical protein